MTYPQYPGSNEPTSDQPGSSTQVGPKSLSGLALAVAATAVVLTIVEVVEAGLAWSAQDAYVDAARTGTNAADVLTAYDVVSIPFTLVLVAAYVLTCWWLLQARQTVEARYPGIDHARSRFWVWAGWIVPIVNLWFPHQIVRDILKKKRRDEPPPILGWWWPLWLLTELTALIGTRLTSSGRLNESLVSGLGTIESINAAVTVIALFTWLLVIRRIDASQRVETTTSETEPPRT